MLPSSGIPPVYKQGIHPHVKISLFFLIFTFCPSFMRFTARLSCSLVIYGFRYTQSPLSPTCMLFLEPIRDRFQGFHPCWLRFTCSCSSLFQRIVYLLLLVQLCLSTHGHLPAAHPCYALPGCSGNPSNPTSLSSYDLYSVLYLHDEHRGFYNPLILLPFTSDIGYLVRCLLVTD